MAHHDKRCREVQTVIGTALQQHLVGLRVVILGVHHPASRPLIEFVDDLLNRQFTLHLVEFHSPVLQPVITLEVNVPVARHHLEVGGRQRHASQTRGQTRSEILLVHLLLQRDGRSRIDEVPGHHEVLQDTVDIRIGLSVFLIMERFQFQRLLVDP